MELQTAERGELAIPPGILVDHEIIKAQAGGLLEIDPFDKEFLEPATYDLGVGDRAVISTASKVLDLTSVGYVVIEPGAMAILQTLESLRLSKRIAGRVGPKHSLLRHGLFVSIGPQVDPGFHGRLITNLINLSPRPFAIRYKDRILSAEFHLLPAEPTRSYEGPYQDRMELSSEEIEVLLAYQGPNLADLHRSFAELRDNIREVAALGKEIPRLIELQEKVLREIFLMRGSAGLEPSGMPLATHISNFEPELYDVKITMPVIVRPLSDGYEANFFDANIHASGDTEEEALRNLKALILDVYDSLSSMQPGELGPEPSRQLRVLNRFIARRR